MSEEKHINTPETVKANPIKGEKIIFDILVKEKMAHIIVIKDNPNYHVNFDGEDIGYFSKDNDGKIERFSRHKGSHHDDEHYFKPVEEKLQELGK